jgi:uncharacterized protein
MTNRSLVVVIDGTSTVTLGAALLAGVAGSAHCVAMCGGVAGALSMRTRSTTTSAGGLLRDASLYHAGRLGGYLVAGALFGSAGVALQSVLAFPALITAVRGAAALLVILVATRLLLGWNTLAAIERLGVRFWRIVQPLARQTASMSAGTRSLMLGLLWGWLPCGLVYSMLLFAALSGDALTGASIMLAFGVGTLPAMLASSLFASHITSALRRHGTRQAVGVLLFTCGLWLGWAAMPPARHTAHDHTAAAYYDGD